MEFSVSVGVELHILTRENLSRHDLESAFHEFEKTIKKTKNGEIKIMVKLMESKTESFDIIKDDILRLIPPQTSELKGTKWLRIKLYENDFLSLYFDHPFLRSLCDLGLAITVDRYKAKI